MLVPKLIAKASTPHSLTCSKASSMLSSPFLRNSLNRFQLNPKKNNGFSTSAQISKVAPCLKNPKASTPRIYYYYSSQIKTPGSRRVQFEDPPPPPFGADNGSNSAIDRARILERDSSGSGVYSRKLIEANPHMRELKSGVETNAQSKRFYFKILIICAIGPLIVFSLGNIFDLFYKT